VSELAHWDSRRDGLRVPIVLATGSTVYCLLTRGAAQALASRPVKGARECAGVLRRCAPDIVAITEAKLRRATAELADVVIVASDVALFRH
jgi:hypothetical protein